MWVKQGAAVDSRDLNFLFPLLVISQLHDFSVMARLLRSLRQVLGLTATPISAPTVRARAIDTDFSIFRGALRQHGFPVTELTEAQRAIGWWCTRRPRNCRSH